MTEEKPKSVKDVVTEWAKANLGVKEEIAAWLLLRWGKNNMDKSKLSNLVVTVLQTALGNAKAAWILSAVGSVVVLLGIACTQGQELLSHETCAKVLVVSGALNVFTRFAPHPADDSAEKK